MRSGTAIERPAKILQIPSKAQPNGLMMRPTNAEQDPLLAMLIACPSGPIAPKPSQRLRLKIPKTERITL